jgi:hypothetical protein
MNKNTLTQIKGRLLFCMLVGTLRAITFINYDDFQMDNNLCVGGNFENPTVSISSYLTDVYGWKYRTGNI